MAPFTHIIIPFCLGIVSARYFNMPMAYSFLPALSLAAAAIIFSNKKAISHSALYLAIFITGAMCYQNSAALPNDHISNFAQSEPKKVLLKGAIRDDPSVNQVFYGVEKTGFVLAADSMKEAGVWHNVRGQVKVDVYSAKLKNFQFGDKVILEGYLSRPQGLKNPGLFDYAEYLKLKNIYAVLKVKDLAVAAIVSRGFSNPVKSIAYGLRRKIGSMIDRHLRPPYSGFSKAALIGDRSGLPGWLKDDFVKTGTIHIIAISGLNITLIASIIMAFFGLLRLPAKPRFILTSLFLLFYLFIAGASPPVTRAFIIFVILVVGHLMQREADLFNSLSLAAFLILLWDPKELFDPAFQLSFVSVASMLIFTPKLNNLFGIDKFKINSVMSKVAVYLAKGASVSIAAWIGTWPIVAGYFNIVSPVSVVANLFVVPLTFLIIIISFLFLAAGFVSVTLGSMTAYCLRLLESFLFFGNHKFSELPFSYFRVPAPSPAFLVIYYIVVLYFVLGTAARTRGLKSCVSAVLAASLVYLNVCVWGEVIDRARGRMAVSFLDVGHGDAAVIELPNGRTVLIDGGPGGIEDRFDAGRNVIAPYLWNRNIAKIDLVAVTHLHDDHLGGIIYMLNNFKVGRVVDNGSLGTDSEVYHKYIDTIKQKGIPRVVLKAGDLIDLSAGVKIFILNPSGERTRNKIFSENDNSLVMKLVYKNFEALFCGDVTEKTIDYLNLYGNFLQSQVVKIPHHGSGLGNETTVKEFFEHISPKISVISGGEIYMRRSNCDEIMNIITCLNSSSYNTKKDGAIVISTYGRDAAVDLRI